MFRWLKLKLFITLALVHVGFLFGMWGLWGAYDAIKGSPQWISFSPHFSFLLFGGFFIYGSLVGGLLWLYAPLAPWMRRARSFRHFKTWILEELPTILGVLTSMAALYPVLHAAWRELKKAQESGKLDFKRFSRVARKVADHAESAFVENGADHDEADESTGHAHGSHHRNGKRAA